MTARLFAEVEKAGWTRRRFNPAFAQLLPYFSWCSQQLQAEFPTKQFTVDAYRLKQFV